MDPLPTHNLPTEMLAYMMEMLPLRDVLSCREVSSMWKKGATIAARKKCVPIPFSRTINIHQRRKLLSEFNDCVREANDEFPVSTFHLTWNSADRWIESGNRPSCVVEFFKLVSPFITELSLEFRLGTFEVRIDKMKIEQHEYPKLKSLTLQVVSDKSGAGKCKSMRLAAGAALFSFLKSVIKKASNFDSVAFKIYRDIQARNTIQKCLTGIGILENIKLLTSLSILCTFNRVDWQSLTTMGLKLKTFSIFMNGESAVDSAIMKAFLKSQANTLSSLELDFQVTAAKHRVSTSIDFPTLSQLKQLRIGTCDNIWLENGLRFPSLSYQEQFPALKELDLFDADGSQADLFATRLAPLGTVQKLILPSRWEDGVEMSQVTRLFPDVKKLQLSHARHVDIIFRDLTGIEELRLPNIGACSDFIIAGLPKPECDEIEEPPSESFNSAVEKLQRQRHATTLACLENLKVLKIHNDNEEYYCHVEMREISAYVLKKMQSLKRLDFGVRKFYPFVRKAVLEDLEKHGIRVTSQEPPHKRAVFGLLPPSDDLPIFVRRRSFSTEHSEESE